jgi:hypothetical protein
MLTKKEFAKLLYDTSSGCSQTKANEAYAELHDAFRGSFQLEGVEAERAKAWIEEHDAKHVAEDDPPDDDNPVAVAFHVAGQRYAGAIGGAYTYEFTPTSIGDSVWVRCSCGEKHDCTDYDCW